MNADSVSTVSKGDFPGARIVSGMAKRRLELPESGVLPSWGIVSAGDLDSLAIFPMRAMTASSLVAREEEQLRISKHRKPSPNRFISSAFKVK